MSVESNAFILTKNNWEKIQDPQIILDKATNILDELLCEDIISIGITGQMHGIVYLNEQGNHISPLYIWQDGRGDLNYQGTTYANYLHSATGYGNVTHFYNKVNNILANEMATYCSIYDYFAIKICGEKKPVLHVTTAASLGQFDLKKSSFTYEFESDIINRCGIIGCYKNIPVSVGIGDNQASFIGSVRGGESVLVNVGTGSQVSVMVDHVPIISRLETRPCMEGNYLLVGSALCGGRSYAMHENFFKETVYMVAGVKPSSCYDAMAAILQDSPATNLIFDNRFSGTRENPDIRGSINNIGLDNFMPKDFIVGTLLGIVNELYEMYQSAGLSAKKLVGSGNGIRRNKQLQKLFELRFGLQMEIPLHKEEAAYGAMLFSLVAVGYVKSIEEAQQGIQYEGYHHDK